MIHALGYSETSFTPTRPGRLCRGRERWIEPWPRDDDAPDDRDSVYRLVVTGAEFEDDSAARASRGTPFSGLELAHLLNALLPRRGLVAFCEDGHPADMPEDAAHVELYTGQRAGGRSEELRVRWVMPVQGLTELRAVLGSGPEPHVQGFAWLRDGQTADDDGVREALYLLTGMGNVDSPPARFQPAALPDVFEVAKAVILLHRDKHGPAIGLYAPAPIDGITDRLVSLTESHGGLPVRFAIPPMLARWDRALSEARAAWLESRDDPFPVPAAPESSRRGGRDRRGRRDMARRAAAQARQARGEEE